MCLNFLPNEILFMIVSQLVFDLHSHEPAVPTQLLHLASTCKKLRQLIYPIIFKIGKFESNHSVSGSLLLSRDSTTLDNIFNNNEKTIYFITCVSNFEKPMTIHIPENILEYIHVLTFPEIVEPITLLCLKNSQSRTYPDCTMIIDPLITPNLSTINLAYCAYSSFWEKSKSVDMRLYRYQKPLSLQLTSFAPMPKISQKLLQLVSSLSISIANDNTKFFKLAWENISGMSNLKILDINSTNFDQIPKMFPKVANLIIQSLKKLQKLEELYIDNYNILLPMDRSWLPETVTTLECSTSNFIETLMPTINKRNNNAKIFFHSVKILTIVVRCNNIFNFKRLPFNNLTELNIIGEGNSFKDQTAVTTDRINAIVENLIKQNLNINRFSAVVSWKLDVSSTLKRLINIEQLSLSILEFTLENNTLVLDELFATISEFCPKLRKLSVRVVSSCEVRPVLKDAVLAQFVASHSATELEILVHLKDVDERLAAFFNQNVIQKLKIKWLIPYLPLTNAVGGSSEYISLFKCKSYRKSLSYGGSWIITFVFKQKG